MDCIGGSCSSMEKVIGDYGDQPHVLAVDDNLIDRKLVEKLLKNSSCKGNASPFFFLFNSLKQTTRIWFCIPYK